MKMEKIKVDSKGRIVLPRTFRSSMGIKEGDFIFASLDEVHSAIIVSPITEKKQYVFDIIMGDKPGMLAKLANVLAENNVDILSSETHSLLRKKEATWHLVCLLKGTKKSKLRASLKKAGAKKINIRNA